MPLVTRLVNQGNLFKVPAEPAGWQNGDLWVEDDVSPPVLRVNNSGTATRIDVQTQISFDNVRTQLTASQTDETIPATGESDDGQILSASAVANADTMDLSANSGTNYDAQRCSNGIAGAEENVPTAFGNVGNILHIGNSTGRYRIVVDATVGTRTLIQMVTTITEQ